MSEALRALRELRYARRLFDAACALRRRRGWAIAAAPLLAKSLTRALIALRVAPPGTSDVAEVERELEACRREILASWIAFEPSARDREGEPPDLQRSFHRSTNGLMAVASVVCSAQGPLGRGLAALAGRVPVRRRRAAWQRRYLVMGASRRALAVVFGCVLALSTVELLLRVVPFDWPLDLDNYLHSCYEPEGAASAIFFFSERPQVRLHKPHFEASCRFNRRNWRHRSDQLGNRNPEDWERVDVLLLGDSMVYGHGVEEDQTFASRLRAETGRRVANAGRSGASAVEYLAMAQSFLPLLRPKVVVIFLFRNDLGDIRRARSPDQVKDLVERDAAPEARAYTPAELFENAQPSVQSSLFDRLLFTRLVRYYWFRIVYHRGDWSWLDRPRPRIGDPEALAYLRAALTKIAESAQATHSRLVLAYMPASALPRSPAERRAQQMRNETRALAERFDLPLFDPSPALIDGSGQSDPAAYLADDWHMNAEGHRRLARELADFLGRGGLLD